MLVEEIRREKKQMYKQGFLEGKLEGKLEEKLEVAKYMMGKGLSIPLIAEITGLSKEEIETINNVQTSPGANN